MRVLLTTLLCFLLSIVYSQELPEVIIDPVIFKNTMEIDEYQMRPEDTSSVCFLEGHYECPGIETGSCDTVETINYGTMLTNVGQGIAYYGRPCCDPGWADDPCHGHDHYEPGIQVQLDSFNHTTYQWDFVSMNAKLDYEMANQQKHPAEYRAGAIVGYDSVGCPVRSHSLVVTGDVSWFTQYAPIDTIAAKWKSECISCSGHGCIDEFYIYPTQDYNSGNRGILPYFGDYYGPHTEGNWNTIPRVNNFYRLRASHTPLFEQRNLFPDTVEVIFYKQGKVIIHDTLPPTPPVIGDTIPDFIHAEVANGVFGTRLIHIPGMDYPGIVYRHWVQGNRIQDGGLPIPVSSEYVYDALAPANEFYIYKSGGKISNKIKFK